MVVNNFKDILAVQDKFLRFLSIGFFDNSLKTILGKLLETIKTKVQKLIAAHDMGFIKLLLILFSLFKNREITENFLIYLKTFFEFLNAWLRTNKQPLSKFQYNFLLI